MIMLSNIGVGFLMMVVTTIIHTVFMLMAFRVLKAHQKHRHRTETTKRMTLVGMTVLVMFGASLVEVSAYAGVYLLLGAISQMEPALYFSTVTYTTLGYGDMVLDPRWRLLASFEAANGIIMFGWTTALVIAAVQRSFFPEH